MKRFKILEILGINYLYQQVILGGAIDSAGNPAGNVGISQIPKVTHTRNLAIINPTHPGDDTVSTSNTVFFSESLDIRTLDLFALNNTAGSIDAIDEAVLFVVNAPDATTVKSWLGDTGGSEADVPYLPIQYNEHEPYSQDSPITRVDFLPLNDISRIIAVGSKGE